MRVITRGLFSPSRTHPRSRFSFSCSSTRGRIMSLRIFTSYHARLLLAAEKISKLGTWANLQSVLWLTGDLQDPEEYNEQCRSPGSALRLPQAIRPRTPATQLWAGPSRVHGRPALGRRPRGRAQGMRSRPPRTCTAATRCVPAT